MKHFQAKRLLVALLAVLLAACSAQGAYWIPPYAPPTTMPFMAMMPVGAFVGPGETAPSVDEAQPPDENPALATFDPVLMPPAPATPAPTPEVASANTAPILYYAQAADTLPVVAVRFGVRPEEIVSAEPIPESGFIHPGQLMVIPRRLGNTTSSQQLLPDSEVVYSPSATDFDAVTFAKEAGGYLNYFTEWHKSTGMKSGAEIVMRVALENSINPRFLLALLEFHGGWVYGRPDNAQLVEYPMGIFLPIEKGLYNQLVYVVNQISIGYYDYREGRLTEIRFKDGVTARLAPDLNAGTAALQYYFAMRLDSHEWVKALDPETGFPALYEQMFGNPWARAQNVEPLFPPGATQPTLILPFGRNWTWAFTGGPHGAWEKDGAFAALDFAPGTNEPGCVDSNAWVVAVASGLVVRTGPGLVVIDLDGDGHEQTGWVIVYLHIATRDRIPLGAWVAAGEKIGHASCEGGFATGTHIHIARKFNGEWVPADGPVPFNLGGWVAQAGGAAYQGTLTRGDATVTACTCSNYLTFITRTDDDP